MTMMELKSILVHRISEINDVRFLELTDDQMKEIAESKKQIQEGLFIKESDLDSEI